ncbi:MAG: bifunctional 23S rRNA (guanine(2069)-N(7))-methyltransferase RlmK/23S rRNA (guanine(2445)-N(2))-methyltransferase RlmL [Thermoguttaceae bacterium]
MTTSPPAKLDLIATSTFGLEAVVARELHSLGYESKIIQPGRVLFAGDESDICRTNLWLRTADRVLVRLDTFEAHDFGQLFDRTRALPWEDWLTVEAEFPVTGRSVKSQLSSVPACQKIVKKAVVERLKAAYGNDWFLETGPKYSLEVALLNDQVMLTIDTSGPGLHKRGYRLLTAKAPLKETLAAAMILLSVWRPQRPLIDPFCGSGTIPVEAALIGRNMAPGLARTFAAEAWPRVPSSLWEAARQQAREAANPDLPARIIGTDVDEGVLGLARFHAEKAGVAADIHFQQRTFAELSSKRPYGCVICNPPYGERLGQSADALAVHRAMPDVFRRLKTWSFFILTALPDFEAVVGQSATRRRKLYNGRIECTYYQFLGPKPGAESGQRAVGCGQLEEAQAQNEQAMSPAAEFQPGSAPHVPPVVAQQPTAHRPLPAAHHPPAAAYSTVPPVFGGLSAKALEQAEVFRARLTKRARHLRRWPTKMGVTCYRLYEQDIPEVPLVVDRYEDYLHIAEFSRPTDHTPAQHADWLDLMQRTAAEVTEVPLDHVFLKRRERQRGTAQYGPLGSEQHLLVAHEGGLQFEVNLSDYLDTGLFLDHRITRGMVRNLAAGKRFLNLFAYTGSFTVYAAAGRAASTATVDLSNTYLDWAQRNMARNGFQGPDHEFIRDDALHFLHGRPTARVPRRLAAFDLAVVDAPTFSNSKSLEDYWDIQRNHVELLNRLVELMAPDGIIFFSTNFRRFKLADKEIRGVAIREISRQTVPADFRNRRIHRCWRMAREG